MTLRRAAADPLGHGTLVLTIGDSLSEILAHDKGRSCDKELNAHCRQGCAQQVAADIGWRRRHIGSQRNCADRGCGWRMPACSPRVSDSPRAELNSAGPRAPSRSLRNPSRHQAIRADVDDHPRVRVLLARRRLRGRYLPDEISTGLGVLRHSYFDSGNSDLSVFGVSDCSGPFDIGIFGCPGYFDFGSCVVIGFGIYGA